MFEQKHIDGPTSLPVWRPVQPAACLCAAHACMRALWCSWLPVRRTCLPCKYSRLLVRCAGLLCPRDSAGCLCAALPLLC